MSKVLTTYKRPSIRNMIKGCKTSEDVNSLVNGTNGLFLKGKMKVDTYDKIITVAQQKHNELANKS